MNYKNFNAIVFTGDNSLGSNGFITYKKQSSISRFKQFCIVKYPLWRFITIYDRKTNEKEIIKR
jgi:hypothetical protein